MDHAPASAERELANAADHYLRPNSNTGFGGGVREAMSRHAAEVVLLLNPDAVAQPTWARDMHAALDADPRHGMAATRVLSATRPGELDSAGLGITRGGMGFLRGHGLPADTPEHLLNRTPLLGPSGAAAAYRVKLIEALGGFPDVYFLYYEDLEVAWRAQRAGWTCAWVDAPLVSHAHNSSAGRSKRYYLQRGRHLFARRNPDAVRSRADRAVETVLAFGRAMAAGEWGLPSRARYAARTRPVDALRPAQTTVNLAVPTWRYLWQRLRRRG